MARRYVCALVVPLLWIIASAAAINGLGRHSPYDPEYYYLLSSLDITQGNKVGLFHHPGTTAQLFAAVVIAGEHALTNTAPDVVAAVLLDPPRYLRTIMAMTAIVITASLLTVGIVGARRKLPMAVVVACQTAPFLSGVVYGEALARFKPEPFLVIDLALFSAVLLAYIAAEQSPRSLRFAVAFGVLCGFGIITKFTFVPVLVIPVLLLAGARARVVFALSAIASTALFAIPIWTRLDDMRAWVTAVVTHVGLYGDGEERLVDSAIYAQNFVNLMRSYPEFFVVFVTGVAIWTATSKIEGSRERRVLWAVLSSQIVGTVMVTKYFLTPNAIRYLLSSFYLTAMILAVGTLLLLRANQLHARWRRGLLGVLTVLGLFFVGREVRAIPAYVRFLDKTVKQYEANDRQIALAGGPAFRGFAHIYSRSIDTPMHGLLEASAYSPAYQPRLMELFPDVYFCATPCEQENWRDVEVIDFNRVQVPLEALSRKFNRRLVGIYGSNPVIIKPIVE
jgi:hypothetical protein